MKLFLNNVLKGLMIALVVAFLGGFILLNINMTPTNAMVLVSSSIVNSIQTELEEEIDIEIKEDDQNKEKLEEVIQVEDSETKLEINDNIENDNNKDTNLNEENADKQNTDNITNSNNNQTIIDSSTSEETKIESNTKKEEVKVQGIYNPNLEVASTIEAIETYYGKMTGYGPDCVGCSGITASGRNVLNGNIYYEDKTFGTIRIVAGDRSIPFGSIIKVTGLNISNEPILAIVLDRGGMIGFAEGKHSYFDLLYESEQAALSFGRQTATFELLRSGY